MGPEIWYCWGISRTVLSSLSRPVFSRIFPKFSRVTRPENISLVPVPPIREMSSSLVSFKTSSGMQTSTWIPNAILSSPDMNYFPFKVGRGFYPQRGFSSIQGSICHRSFMNCLVFKVITITLSVSVQLNRYPMHLSLPFTFFSIFIRNNYVPVYQHFKSMSPRIFEKYQ